MSKLDKPKLILMCGLPGSGKSYYAKEISIKKNATILSSDEIRKEINGDENCQDKADEVFIELKARMCTLLKEGRSVIIDATNINYKARKSYVDLVSKIPCTKECYLVLTPYEKCLEQNNTRDRKVPIFVIDRMYQQFYVPQTYEGFDDIRIIRNYNAEDYVLRDLMEDLDAISQDNPFHSLTIGEHCRECCKLVSQWSNNSFLGVSALLHDIGKKHCKRYENSKGEKTEFAHYYNHEHVSAYMSLIYFEVPNTSVQLKVANYIQWHMKPFFLDTERAKRRFVNIVGEETYRNLMILNEADKKAK